MFCPLLWIAKPEVDIGLSSEHDCIKERCAWWDKNHKACAILSIFDALNHLLYHIKDIEAKMPSGQSFVK